MDNRLLAPLLALGLTSIAIPAFGYQIKLVPPPTLNLDGMPINEGTFNLTNVTGWSASQPDGFDITPPPPTLTFEMEIGDTEPVTLFEVSDETEVLQLIGFFDAIDPDKPAANFDIIVGPITFATKGVPAYTYYLPAMTDMTTFQVTDVGSDLKLDDNTNYFLNSAPTAVLPDAPDGTPGEDFLLLDNGQEDWFVALGTPSNLVGRTTGEDAFVFNSTPWDVPHGTNPPVPVPEPLTILGSATALGFGALFNRKNSQKQDKSNK